MTSEAGEKRFISPQTPSILGPDVKRTPLAHITLWPIGTITSAHVLPGKLDIVKLEAAISELARLYPVLGGRFSRTERAVGDGYDYWINLTSSGIPLTICTSDSTAPPFPSAAVIQATLAPYVDPVDPTKLNVSADAEEGALFRVKVTYLPNAEGGEKTVLGLAVGHVIGDGAAFCKITEILSRIYEGQPIDELDYPSFEPHVQLVERPDTSVMRKWEHRILYPTFDLPTAFGIYGQAADSDRVQFVLTHDEIKLLKELAGEKGSEESWVSAQDAISSYFIALLRLVGEDIQSVVTSVNYRHLSGIHPSFPATLPSLVANVSQLLAQPLPASSIPLSLRPVAQAIRGGLRRLKSDPESALDWLSVRAYRLKEAADKRETQCMVADETECIVNSNLRYNWNHPFGFDASQTQHHTELSLLNFLRVFPTNPSSAEQGAELTFNVRRGLAEQLLQELSTDRADGWSRWS